MQMFAIRNRTYPRKSRPLSIASRIWLAADAYSPPCWITIMFEGTGRFDSIRIAEAVHTASEANPGSRLILRGHLASSRWTASGPIPPVKVIPDLIWDGMGSEGIDPWLHSSDVRCGPNAEVLLMNGTPARIIFRAHHAIMDGRGTLTWAEDVFRCLNGLPPLGSDHVLVENDLLHLPDQKAHPAPAYDYIPPTRSPVIGESGFVWRRSTLSGHHRDLLAQVLLLAARASWRHHRGPVRFAIPVDLRYRIPTVRSTGNLTNAIFIPIAPEASTASVTKEIKRRVDEYDDGRLNLEDKLIPYIPLQVLKQFLLYEDRQRYRNNRFRCTGLISNLGRIELEKFSGGGFTASTYSVVPVALDSMPLSITLSGSRTGSEMIVRMPRSYAAGGQIEEFLAYITEGLRTGVCTAGSKEASHH
ncbi:MAG: hypothetical protein ACM3QZ_08710 [Solirubrobacterales bacterium]